MSFPQVVGAASSNSHYVTHNVVRGSQLKNPRSSARVEPSINNYPVISSVNVELIPAPGPDNNVMASFEGQWVSATPAFDNDFSIIDPQQGELVEYSHADGKFINHPATATSVANVNHVLTVKENPPTSGIYVWESAVPQTTGITQLTGDVTAGPGTGSVASVAHNLGGLTNLQTAAAIAAPTGVTFPTLVPSVVFRATSGEIQVASISGMTTALPADEGGTGLASVGTDGNVLTASSGAWVSAAPVSPTYPLVSLDGGTGSDNHTATTGQILQVTAGSGSAAVFTAGASPSTAGNVLTSDGANWISSGLPVGTPTPFVYDGGTDAIYANTLSIQPTTGFYPNIQQGMISNISSGSVLLGGRNDLNTYQNGAPNNCAVIGGGNNFFDASAIQCVACATDSMLIDGSGVVNGGFYGGGYHHTDNGSTYSAILGGNDCVLQNGSIGNGSIANNHSDFSATATNCFIAGSANNGIDNTARSACVGGNHSSVSGGSDSVVLGGTTGIINVANSGILGGTFNSVISGGARSVICGGAGGSAASPQTISSTNCFMGGGQLSSIGASATNSALLGGSQNSAAGGAQQAVIGGNHNSTTTGADCVVVGGHDNGVSGADSGLFAGHTNTNAGVNCVIAGGTSCSISSGCTNGFISGCLSSSLNNGTSQAIIAANSSSVASATNSRCAIIGGTGHSTSAGAVDSVIMAGSAHNVASQYCLVSAGTVNHITASCDKSVILGGDSNTLTTSGSSIIAVSTSSSMTGGAQSAVIGGSSNTLNTDNSSIITSTSCSITGGTHASALSSIVAGDTCTIDKSETVAIIAGGQCHSTSASNGNAYEGGIFGGHRNNYTSGGDSVIIGGSFNTIDVGGGYECAIIGGESNTMNAGVGLVISGCNSLDMSVTGTLFDNYQTITNNLSAVATISNEGAYYNKVKEVASGAPYVVGSTDYFVAFAPASTASAVTLPDASTSPLKLAGAVDGRQLIFVNKTAGTVTLTAHSGQTITSLASPAASTYSLLTLTSVRLQYAPTAATWYQY